MNLSPQEDEQFTQAIRTLQLFMSAYPDITPVIQAAFVTPKPPPKRTHPYYKTATALWLLPHLAALQYDNELKLVVEGASQTTLKLRVQQGWLYLQEKLNLDHQWDWLVKAELGIFSPHGKPCVILYRKDKVTQYIPPLKAEVAKVEAVPTKEFSEGLPSSMAEWRTELEEWIDFGTESTWHRDGLSLTDEDMAWVRGTIESISGLQLVELRHHIIWVERK